MFMPLSLSLTHTHTLRDEVNAYFYTMQSSKHKYVHPQFEDQYNANMFEI